MGKFIDMTGYTTESGVVVLNRIGDKGSHWLCKCYCGKEFETDGERLRNGKTKSCGCYKIRQLQENNPNSKNKYKLKNDYSGFISESGVEILERDITTGPRYKWKCRCFCGKIFLTRADSIISGHTKSCGCLQKEKAKIQAIKIGRQSAKDYTGIRSGKLVAIEPTDQRKYDNVVVWKCQCDCGNIIYLPGTRLVGINPTKSCGCISSIGEASIQKILQDNNIPYTTQATFDSCRFEESGYPAKFDFYIDNKYLIEYDGNTHYYANGYGWNNEENLTTVKKHDIIKNEWCRKNNIPLIRIPYTHLDNLCLEDLLLETSTFIYKEGDNNANK